MFGFDEPDVPSVSVDDLKKSIDEKENAVILDVRTPGEVARGKIAGSINIPVDRVSCDIQLQVPDKNNKIYVYCLSGSRSCHATDAMIKLGYKNVFNVQNGMLAWRAKYFPIEI